ncbi:MAG: hypothetical protein ABUS79_17810, partial [Pseudomonadota bacterium]
MRNSSLISTWAPWGGFAAAVAGAALLWHGASPPRATKPAATSQEMAEAEGLRPTSLLVDFRDDASAAAIAAPGYKEQPLSDYSTR